MHAVCPFRNIPLLDLLSSSKLTLSHKAWIWGITLMPVPHGRFFTIMMDIDEGKKASFFELHSWQDSISIPTKTLVSHKIERWLAPKKRRSQQKKHPPNHKRVLNLTSTRGENLLKTYSYRHSSGNNVEAKCKYFC